MESVLCVYNRVILCENINREGKHFFDLIFGKKMEIKNLRDIRMRIWLNYSQLNYFWKNVIPIYHGISFEILKFCSTFTAYTYRITFY